VSLIITVLKKRESFLMIWNKKAMFITFDSICNYVGILYDTANCNPD